MTQTSVYVFSSQFANEAADAVVNGQYESIIQYHLNKYQQGPMTQHPLPPVQQQQKQLQQQQNHYVNQSTRPNLPGQQQSHQQLSLGPSPHSQMQMQPMNNGPPQPPPPPQMQQPPPVNYPPGPQQNSPHSQWMLNHHGSPLDHPQSPHNQHMNQIKYDPQQNMNNQPVNNHITGPPLQPPRPMQHNQQPNFDSANLPPQIKKEAKLTNNGQPPPQMQQQQPPISYQNVSQNTQPGQWMNHHGPLEHPQSPHQQHMSQIKYEQQQNLNNQIPPNHAVPQIRPNMQQSNFDPSLAQQKKDPKLNNGPPPQSMQQHPPVYQNVTQNSQHGQWMNHHGVADHPQSPHQHMSQLKYESNMNNQMPPGHIGPPPTRPNLQQSQPNFEANLTPQQKKERESKLTKLGHLANVISMNPPAQCGPMQTNMTQHQMSQPPQHQLQTQHQIMTQPQHMQQAPQQTPLSIKQDLDPLQSMAAMSESPNMYGHTIHHHPHRQQHPTN